jgi:predicted nucleic acid-binding protein
MTTAIDTNVLIALWDADDTLNSAAQSALDAALRRGNLVIPAPVYAELMASPERNEAFLDSFLQDTGINIDWSLDQAIWRAAGLACRNYAARRRKQRGPGPRRILADFLIGAYARERRCRLLTLDDRFYRISFPGLAIETVREGG